MTSLMTDEIYTFLDKLRASGRINMFGAAPELGEKFILEPEEAKQYILRWMQTYSLRHPT